MRIRSLLRPLRRAVDLPLQKLVYPWPDLNQHRRKKFLKYVRAEGITLDVGCGGGWVSFFIQKSGGRVVGLEGNQRYVTNLSERVQAKGLNHIQFIYGNAKKLSDLESWKGHYDQVVCWEVIEHIIDDDVLLTNLNYVLREGGRLLLSTTRDTVARSIDPQVSEVEDGGHVRWGYSFDGLEEKLRRAGFKIVLRDSCVSWPTQRAQVLTWKICAVTRQPNNFYLKSALFLLLRPFTYLDGLFSPDRDMQIFVLAEKVGLPRENPSTAFDDLTE